MTIQSNNYAWPDCAKIIFDITQLKTLPFSVCGMNSEIIQSPEEKIRIFVNQLMDSSQSDISIGQPTVAYAKFFSSKDKKILLVKELAFTVWRHPEKKESKLSIFALRLLEKADPSIAILNRGIQKYMFGSIQERNRASVYLRNFLFNSKPLEILYPIRPAPLLCPIIQPQQEAHPFWKIHTICLGALIREEQEDVLAENLKEIGAIEGFSAVDLSLKNLSLRWLCDPFFLTEEKVLVPQTLKYEEAFTDLYKDVVQNFRYPMGIIAKDAVHEVIYKKATGLVQRAPFYFEGGNLLETVTKNGERVYLSGGANLLFSAMNLRHTCSDKEIAEVSNRIQFLNEKYLKLANKIANNLRRTNRYSHWSDLEINQLSRLLVRTIPMVKEKINQTMPFRVIHLGFPFAGQPEFHLDMFLALAPEGKVFIHSHTKTIELLEEILSTERLDFEEKERLFAYLQQARCLEKQAEPELNKIAKQLAKEDFDVIKTCGVLYSEQDILAVNYLNSIFGQNDRGIYCITNGSGASCDRFLKKAFIRTLQENGIEHIYFTGRASSNVVSSKGLSYQVAKQGLQDSGGIHCRVQVLRSQKNFSDFFAMLKTIPERFNKEEYVHSTFPVEDLKFRIYTIIKTQLEMISPKHVSALSFQVQNSENLRSRRNTKEQLFVEEVKTS